MALRKVYLILVKWTNCRSLESTCHGAPEHARCCSIAQAISVGTGKFSLPLSGRLWKRRELRNAVRVKRWQPASGILRLVSYVSGFHRCSLQCPAQLLTWSYLPCALPVGWDAVQLRASLGIGAWAPLCWAEHTWLPARSASKLLF